MVIVTRDPVIVGWTFEGAGTELGDDSSFAGHGEEDDVSEAQEKKKVDNGILESLMRLMRPMRLHDTS